MKSIVNLSIRFKLFAIFGLVVFLMAVAGWQGIAGMRDINEELNSIYNERFIPARLIANAHIALIAWNRATLNHVLSESTEKMEMYQQIMLGHKAKMTKQLDELSKMKNLTERGNLLLQKLLNTFQQAETVQHRVIALSKDGKQEERRALIQAELRPIIDEMDKNMTEFLVLQENQLEEKKNETDIRYTQGFGRILIIVFGAIVCTSFMLFLFYRALLNNVTELVRGMNLMSEGNYQSAKVNILSKDELGYLGDGYNHMVDTIKKNISDLEQSENKVRNLNEELKEHVKELESFSYSVSHDLRAPLRHIDGFADLILNNTSHLLAEKSRRHLMMMSESSKKMGQLIDDILHFSRMGRSEMKWGTVNLEQLVREAQSDLYREADGRNIVWKVGALPEVYGDPSMLKLVLVNLLSNALKFTSPRAEAQIEIGCTDGDKDDLVFFVRDNGVGFDMKYVDKLFGVFQRLHRADEFEGTGIGLANIQRIVHRHGGRVRAEGSVDGGATFYFSLPKLQRGVRL